MLYSGFGTFSIGNEHHVISFMSDAQITLGVLDLVQKLKPQQALWNNTSMKTLALISIFSIILLSGCSLFYVAKQGMYQVRLISGSEPIEKVLRSKDLDITQRKKLELILDVRSFAVANLHLTAHKNYKDINLGWDKTIHTVSASEALAFKPYQWWFPVLGSVPYKGFFDEADAHKEEARLKALGYETQNRPIQGYSTLGFFADPVWPDMLKLSDHALIELIIHELAHATIYIPNQTSFNETLANFIGEAGARAYLNYRYGAKSPQINKLDEHHQQQALYRQFFYGLYHSLNDIYQKPLPDSEKQELKNNLLIEAKRNYLKLPINSEIKNPDLSFINNAFLLSFKRYNHDDELFNELLATLLGDWGRFIDEVNFYARADDPFLALKNRLLTLKDSS